MIKIGILGSDNSHAIAMSKLCNLPPQEGVLHVEGAQVTHLFGVKPERNQEVAAAGHIPTIVADPKEMLGKVNAVLVDFRHGDLHKEYALPFIKAGVPTFVDKPLAVKVADAKELLAAAKEKGTPITSFSTIRFSEDMGEIIKDIQASGTVLSGTIYGPADANSEYGGLIFYGIHCMEVMLQVFGYDVATVTAVATEGGSVGADFAYRDGKIISIHFIKGVKGFGMSTILEKGGKHYPIEANTAYRDGFRVFLKMFQTGQMPLTPGQLLRPVELMEAVVKSYTGKTSVAIQPMA